MKCNDLFYTLAAIILVLSAAAAAAGNAPTSSQDEATSATCSSSNQDEDEDQACSVSESESLQPPASASASASGPYYCVDTAINSEYEIFTNQQCFHDKYYAPAHALALTSTSKFNIKSVGDFVTPTKIDYKHHTDKLPAEPAPGQIVITPILWRERDNTSSDSNIISNDNNHGHGGKIVSQYAFQISLPPTLVPALLNYTFQLGITDKFRQFTTTSPIPHANANANAPVDMHSRTAHTATNNHDNGNDNDRPTGQFHTFGTNRWYAQRPAQKWDSNMHWISPADERTHEEYLRVLFEGGFGDMLDEIGEALELDGLVAYHLTFLAVSFVIGDSDSTSRK